jgi:hypothetical protein
LLRTHHARMSALRDHIKSLLLKPFRR